MNAKEYLQRIKEIETQIRHEKSEKERWKELATSCTPGYTETARGSGDLQRMETVIVNGISKEPKFDENIARLWEERAAIISDIRSLPEAQSDVLYMVYVEFLSLKEAAYKRKESYSWVTTLHGIALRSIGNTLTARKSEKK